MTDTAFYHGHGFKLMERQLGVAGLKVLTLRSFLALLLLSLLPGAASAFTLSMFDITRPDLVIPIVLGIEIPFAIWISGFMGAEDRRTIKAMFSNILSMDFSRMSADEVVGAILWGENSVVVFVLRIWIAVAAAMICAITFGQLEPALMIRMEMPPIMVVLISFSLFSYIFVRNMCESSLREQLGHGCLATVFSALLFSGIHAMI